MAGEQGSPAANPAPAVQLPDVMSVDEAVGLIQQSRRSEPSPTAPEPEPQDDSEAETANLDEEPVEGDDSVDGEPDEETQDEGDDVEPDAEAEAEDEDAAEVEEEAQSEDEAGKHRLRIGDEELEVTTEELKSGYLRDRDYRQKTQALADRRRELDGVAQQTAADRKAYRERAEAYEAIIGQLSGIVDAEGKKFESVDWAALKSDDLSEYLVQREEYRNWQDKKRAAEAEKERLTREREADQQREMQAAQVELRKTLYSADYFPHWSDAAKAEADVRDMESVATDLGFTREELSRTVDPRAWKLLHEAAQFRKLKTKNGSAATGTKQAKAASETKPPAVKVLKPNAARPAPQTGKAAALKKVDARLRSDRPFSSIEEAYGLYKTARRARS